MIVATSPWNSGQRYVIVEEGFGYSVAIEAQDLSTTTVIQSFRKTETLTSSGADDNSTISRAWDYFDQKARLAMGLTQGKLRHSITSSSAF